MVLFEAKNTQKRKVFPLTFNKDYFDSIIERLSEAWEYAQKGEVAPRTRDTRSDPTCYRCSKRPLCELLAKSGASREQAMVVDSKLRAAR